MKTAWKRVKKEFLDIYSFTINYFKPKLEPKNKITDEEWKEIISTIGSIINAEDWKGDKFATLKNYISKTKAKDNLDIELNFIKRRKIEVCITAKNLDFLFHEKQSYLFNGEWVLEGDAISFLQVKFIKCEINPCKIRHPEMSLKCSLSLENKLDRSELTFEQSQVNVNNLEIFNVNKSYFSKSKFKNIQDSSENDAFVFNNSCAAHLYISKYLKSLEFHDTSILNLNISFILKNHQLGHFYFDENSEVLETPDFIYKKMRQLVDDGILKDIVQSQIFYKKEIDHYTKQRGHTDGRILFIVNKLTNNHGTSFLKPIFLMYLINIYFIYFLNFSISELDLIYSINLKFITFCLPWPFSLEILIQSGYMALDISPLNEFRHGLSDRMYGVDGLRRVLLAVLTYSTISAALRFKFKK